jgi:PIN domain nuclease of toxin-antitoxin system
VRLLIDTHALLWWFADDPALGPRSRAAIADPRNETFVSALTLAEIPIKQGMTGLALTPRHGRKLAELPLYHRDPFDRMLIAQALEEGLTVLTSDARFAEYGVPVLAA